MQQSATQVRAVATAQGLSFKRANALTAVLFGGTVAFLVGRFIAFRPIGLLEGLLIGLLYGNVFEYCFHRFLLHLSGGFLAEQHLKHHATWGAPDEALFVNFARNRWGVIALFAANCLPFVVLEWLLRTGLVAGVFVGFVLYFILFEEIHWRIHMGGRLPGWLSFAKRHHLLHHVSAEERFNVFLPLLDWLLTPKKATPLIP